MLHPAPHELVEQRTDHQVAVGGVRGHDAGMVDAPALVLLHGFTNSGASWQPVISGLGQRYRALAPDIRGHASASTADPVTLDAVLADIHHKSHEECFIANSVKTEVAVEQQL